MKSAAVGAKKLNEYAGASNALRAARRAGASAASEKAHLLRVPSYEARKQKHDEMRLRLSKIMNGTRAYSEGKPVENGIGM